MSHLDFGRYKRIVQYFWDPEPKNDDESNSPIWCLGTKYDCLFNPLGRAAPSLASEASHDKSTIRSLDGLEQTPKRTKSTSQNGGQVDLPVVQHEEEGNRGWPENFLDDFESRLWFTYRSNFPAIKKSPDLKGSNSITLAVRLRSQLVDQGGFTSDTGWGCMIRSGQSLLANALVMLRLGRGMKY